METQGETEQGSLCRFAHICAIVCTIALILGLWHTNEAATSYNFIGFDAPLDRVTKTFITGVEYKSGVLIGTYRDVYGNEHGWRGNKNSATMVPLLPLSGINRQKWTVGSFRPTPGLGAPPSDLRQGFLNTGTAMIPITVPGCTNVEAHAVNDAGEVVGRCEGDGTMENGLASPNHAFYWKDGVGTIRDPVILDGGQPFFFSHDGCRATGINNAGVIVGSCDDAGYIDNHGVFTVFMGSLGQPPSVYTYPQGINDKGTIFGKACDDAFDNLFEGDCAGFIMRQGVMSFVSYPSAQLTEITAVHPTNGRIWGNWQDSAGVWHAFTATPASQNVASR
jgi:hypothetical protein